MENPKKAVVLVSGGLDSVTALAIAQSDGFDCHALSVDYGQRHHSELDAAIRVAEAAGVPLKILPLDLRAIGGSALTDDIDVPEHETTGIPVTYVPARNTIMLSLALAHAEVLGAAFGLQERFKVLATADVQILEALDRFGQASELLTARLELDESADSKSPSVPGSPLN